MRSSISHFAKKPSASSSRWIARARSDPFRASASASAASHFKHPAGSANDVGSLYVARSAHKLVEIDRKYRFLKPNKTILDLGASPGGWSQVCLDQLRGRGRVIGVDLLDLDARVATRPHLDFVQGDLRQADTLAKLDALIRSSTSCDPEDLPTVDVVLSDMLGNTSGNDVRDSQNSLELCNLVVDLSQRYLTPDPSGTVIFKIFQSQDAAQWKKDRLEKLFARVSVFKPASSRKESREVYYICKEPRK